MRSFRSFLSLSIIVAIGEAIGIAIESELFVVIFAIIGFLGVIIIFSNTKSEIKETEYHRLRFEKLMLFLQKQGFQLPEDLLVGQLVNFVNLQIEVSYTNETTELITEVIYINVTLDTDVNNWLSLKTLIHQQNHIYKLPDNFSIISVKTH